MDSLQVAAGALTGFVVGMTGVGGGALMTPVLVLLFGTAPLTAVGTDLWFAAITKLAVSGLHLRRGLIDWPIVGRLWLGSLPASMLPAYYNNGVEIIQAPGYVVIRLEMIHEARVIPVDGRPQIDEKIKQWLGEPRGRWEGDTLVVDTASLLPGTLFNNGVDYTENVHLLERFRLADPSTLVVTQQFEDPGSFEGTAARIMSFRRGNDHVYPYDCDPTYGLSIESRQGPARE